METKLFKLIISKVDGPIFNGEALSVTVPGALGEMTLLSGHEALISPLASGVITIRTMEGTSEHEIAAGTLECSNNQVVILL